MVLAVSVDELPGLMTDLLAAGETPHVIGVIESGERGCTVQGDDETWSARAAWEAIHLA
jgi:phosphoribosylformylglycinamidine cyclo-ligase